eukprot:TRINITY_DN2368_c0_g2_i2.p1 TRINITY_DN2368_c0_g2~~TRINITY_DN2368_c0_g2_i2.p1  ORF type:complete len:238 (+),score=59.17 TRINITY_DN2368_c0_g2_i2:149-862(+)
MDIMKYFLLFDLNGTLLCKKRYRIDCPREPDLTLKKLFQIYFRPEVVQLLPALLSHPLVRVGVYSSMKRHTINSILDALLERISCVERKNAILVFDHEYCIPDPMGKNLQDTLKDLLLVWDGNYSKKLKMNKSNTILIESDVQRIGTCFSNLLRMVPYKEDDVLYPSTEKELLLTYYKEYLIKLIESGTDDVTEYLAANSLPQEITKYLDKPIDLSLIHICRCRRLLTCRSRWSPYH